ncbi:MAG TPA: flagellin [Verrucomicrobiae bacterium]|jgi:flagellin-like hook-associated protein FlgL|nr:flagellin [Verrucomicrobiae bacterium]
MLINTDLSNETSAANLQRQRAESGTTAPQPSSGASASSAASQLDPSLQRLTQVPAGLQDADLEIHDKQGAAQAVEMARQAMLKQPGTAMSAQANQLHQNVLSLLQPAD